MANSTSTRVPLPHCHITNLRNICDEGEKGSYINTKTPQGEVSAITYRRRNKRILRSLISDLSVGGV